MAALLVRPWPWKPILFLSVVIWAGLDLLVITGLFDVYGLLQGGEDLLYFEF